jgi:hypothetical protein
MKNLCEFWQSQLIRFAWWLIAKLLPATHIVLAIPRITRKGKAMPNYELENDKVYTIPIQTAAGDGAIVPPPAGDIFTAVSSSPSLGVAVVTSPVLALTATPLVENSPNISVTISDNDGLAVWTQIFDIVTDLTPTNVVLDLAGAITTTQPVPTAPGP